MGYFFIGDRLLNYRSGCRQLDLTSYSASMVNIPPKYGSGLPQQDREPIGNIFERLNQKIKYEQENIKPC
jgi:hypothetical protein